MRRKRKRGRGKSKAPRSWWGDIPGGQNDARGPLGPSSVGFPPLSGSDADRIGDRQDENLAVADGFDGISDINLKVNGSAELAYGLGIGVTAVYTIVSDDDINEDNEFWTLTSLTYSF